MRGVGPLAFADDSSATLPNPFLLKPSLGLALRLRLGPTGLAPIFDGMVLAGPGDARPAHDLRPRVLEAPTGRLRTHAGLGLGCGKRGGTETHHNEHISIRM